MTRSKGRDSAAKNSVFLCYGTEECEEGVIAKKSGKAGMLCCIIIEMSPKGAISRRRFGNQRHADLAISVTSGCGKDKVWDS